MVLASRQYVRAQEGELASLFSATGWSLYQRLWRWTTDANPELEAAQRRQLLDQLTAPLRDTGTAIAVKAVLTGRLFQVLLLAHISDDFSSRPSPPEEEPGRGHS